jgi:lactoylglutathione lyase
MKLNHLNLSVSDVPQTARFFEEFLGLRCTELKGKDTPAVLYDENGFALILSFDRKTTPSYPKDFHLGFIQDNQKRVSEIHERLQTAGYEINPPRAMHGSWGFYFRAPSDIEIEISCPLATQVTA